MENTVTMSDKRCFAKKKAESSSLNIPHAIAAPIDAIYGTNEPRFEIDFARIVHRG